MGRLDLKAVSLKELRSFVETHGEPRFRAAQILDWLYNHHIARRIDSISEMSNVSKSCQEKLLSLTSITSLSLHDKKEIPEGLCCIFQSEDLHLIPVFLRGDVLSLAAQIGSSYNSILFQERKPWIRDLTVGEIVDQVVKTQNVLGAGSYLCKVAFDGEGEPLANFNAVAKAIEIIHAKWGLKLFARNIKLSTYGLVPQIKQIANSRIPVNLSIKLHAIHDQIRTFLIPVNKKYPLEDLLEAIKYYSRITGRTVNLEYTLIEGLNDSLEDAKLMIKRLVGLPIVVNLVPYISVPGSSFLASGSERQEQFLHILNSGNINAFDSIPSPREKNSAYVMEI